MSDATNTRSDRWTTQFAVLIALLAFAVLVVAACGGGDGNGYGASESPADESAAAEPVAVTGGDSPEAELPGEQLFIANCSMCHGANASGTAQGPPLLHEVYEPGHHPDASFVIAVSRGVRQHHWQFGNMPAVPDLSIDQIQQVICFVRNLQVADGIIAELPASTRC